MATILHKDLEKAWDDKPLAGLAAGMGLATPAENEQELKSLDQEEIDGMCARLEANVSKNGLGGLPRRCSVGTKIAFDAKGRVIRDDTRNRAVAPRRAGSCA